MENTKIQWAHHTFNHIRGCTKVSEGCEFCYAAEQAKRNPAVLGVWGPHGTREVASENQWKLPHKWNSEAARCGERHRVFCASMADVFEGPETFDNPNNDAHDRLFQLIHETPCLDWLLLTKRPQHVLPLFGNWLHWSKNDVWPRNAWVGITVENQKRFDERVKYVGPIRAAGCPVLFFSCEPLLEFVNVAPALDREYGVNWLIVGGESGAKAKVREFNPQWARLMKDQAGDAGVPFFVKQLGSRVLQLTLKDKKGGDLEEWPADLRVREFPQVV